MSGRGIAPELTTANSVIAQPLVRPQRSSLPEWSLGHLVQTASPGFFLSQSSLVDQHCPRPLADDHYFLTPLLELLQWPSSIPKASCPFPMEEPRARGQTLSAGCGWQAG